MSNSLRPHGLQPARAFCPWDFPGKHTGMGCHSLLQGNLPDPGIEPKSPALQVLYCLSHQRSPLHLCVMTQITHIPVHNSLLFVPRSAVISFLSGLILPTVRVLLMAVTNKPLNYSALIIEICFWCLCSVVTFLTVIPGPTLLVILQYC